MSLQVASICYLVPNRDTVTTLKEKDIDPVRPTK
ncbi:unnamed protein product [Brassica oleracea var. botrytis]